MKKTDYYSYQLNDMPKGCKQCVNGEKLVLFVTGKCDNSCYYCPLSEQKKNKDSVWANEWKITNKKDVVEEAKLCNSKGAGITGGDPLLRLDRTVKYIEMLKSEFGKSFHIHLYTPLNLVTRLKLKKLHDAGLDEIRFHPNLEKPGEWGRILLAKNFDWDIGIEVPVIPHMNKELRNLIKFAKEHVNFINLNELEMSDSNACQLSNYSYKPRSRLSYGVAGSEQLAKSILKSLSKSSVNVHFCTAKLKDAVQLRNRIKRRAKNIAQKFDKITEDGTLMRGVIYLKSLMPGPDYKLRLQTAKKNFFLKRLYKIKKDIKLEYNLDFDSIYVDRSKLRILTSPQGVKKMSSYLKEKNLVPAIVEEYPTHDALESEIDFL